MLIDTHAHLETEEFDKDRDLVLQRAVNEGLTHIITVGTDLESSEKAVKLAEQYEIVHAAVGCHPHNAHSCGRRILDRMAEVASDKKVVAWGEIGLDYYRKHSDPEQQLKIFRRQLEIARDLELPVIIHDRDAHEDIFKSLKAVGKNKNRGVIHCFSGDTDLANALIELGYYISIPGTVTYKKASLARRVAASVPLEYLLVETDAPFLAPAPHRGRRNEPCFVSLTAKEIAGLREMEVSRLGKVTSENARRLFKLK
jgi:TatD DNase family protein